MECDICFRGHDANRLPFVCAVDAQSQVYQGRFQSLRLLFESEKLQADIDQAVTDSPQPSLDLMLVQQRQVQDRTDQILAAADKLRAEIQAARDEVRARKLALARRRSDLASVSGGLLDRRARQHHEVDKASQILRFRWSQSAQELAHTRAFLCSEAVRLYGLKRTKKGSTGRYDYHIGRVPVLDLATMDALSPEAISTSLANVAHILMLVSHYLAIRLPAEITLPHRDFPQPTIFNLAGSHRNGPLKFPNSFNATPALQPQDPDAHHVPRPRPLFVDKPLPQLFKDDPAVYSFFLEGVTLLAYNIAWLCSTQGVSIGDKASFDDICNMGRNLYSLLLGAQMQGHSDPSVTAVARRVLTQDEAADSPANWMGRYSHGTMYYYLGGIQGTELTRSFKLPSPMKLADRLKKKLLGDTSAADWEVLDDDAWKVDELLNDAGGAKGKSGVVRSIKEAEGKARISSNGWTRVKHRT